MLNVFSIWACDETFKVIFFKLSFNEESQNIIEFLELIRTCFSLITFFSAVRHHSTNFMSSLLK